MTFLTPLLAGIAAAIAVPSLVILYFLKLRRRDLEVSTTLLWRKAIQDMQANAPFQRLRRNILLILQLLALAAALFALAQPQITANVGGGARHVLLIDRSASMQAVDGDPARPGEVTRLEAARKRALEVIDSLKEPGLFGEPGDQAMVIAFDTAAGVVENFTDNRVELRRAVEGIEAVDTPSSLVEGVKLARAFLPKRVQMDRTTGELITSDEQTEGGVTMHIFSDGALPDAGSVRTQKGEDVVNYYAIGSPEAWNVGITTIRADRAYDDPSRLSVYVGLQSTATTPKNVDVQLSIEGSVVRVREVALGAATVEVKDPNADAAPGEAQVTAAAAPSALRPATSGIVFTVDRADGGVVGVSLRVPGSDDGTVDALKVDDVGYLSIPPAKRLAVAVIGEGNLFLTQLLTRALTLARPPTFVPTARGQAFLTSREAAEHDVIILDGWLPELPGADGRPAPSLPPGRFLVFDAVPAPPFGLRDRGAGETTLVLDWRRDHPTLRGINFDSVVISEARKVELGDSGAVVLASGKDGPLVAELADATRRALVVTFDLRKSTWPIDAGFALFVAKSLDYLARDGAAEAVLTVEPGGTLTERLPQGAADVRVTLPNRSDVALTPSSVAEVNYGPVQRTGIYTVSWSGPAGPTDVTVSGRPRRAVAANLADAAESDVATRRTLPLAGDVVAAQTARGPATLSLWPYLLLALLGVAMLEWWVYNRKVVL